MEKSNNMTESHKSFEKQSIRIGIITVSLAIAANFAPALYLWFFKGISLNFGAIMSIWGLAFVTFGVSWFVQPISYFTSLGIAGSYIGWVCGSVADIRLPAANMAKKAAGVEDSTPQGDVMSTIGVACSVFVSVTIISIFTFIGAGVIESLPASITDAFKYILPSVFGAVYIDMALKNIKLGIVIFVFCAALLAMLKVLPIPSGFAVLFCVIAGMLISRVFYVMDSKKGIN